MNEIELRLRGPEGARQRMKELQGRIDELRGSRTFEDRLRGAIGTPVAALHGEIPPFNPLTSGELSANATPSLKRMIGRIAEEAGVEAPLLEALVSAESAFDPRARSRAGAMGLAQLMPETARELGVDQPFDPEQNLRGGARYLRQMLDRYGDPELALAAYNAGPGRVDRAGGTIPAIPETQRYVQRVMALYRAQGGNRVALAP